MNFQPASALSFEYGWGKGQSIFSTRELGLLPLLKVSHLALRQQLPPLCKPKFLGFPEVSAGQKGCSICAHFSETLSPFSPSYPQSQASRVAQWLRIHLPMQELQETWVRSLGGEDPLEEAMTPCSSILAWKFPWT